MGISPMGRDAEAHGNNMVFSFLAGPPNTIKEQQVAFQAAKKLSGNTHTAGAMGWNIGVFGLIVVGGLVFNLRGLPNLYYGGQVRGSQRRLMALCRAISCFHCR